MNVAWLCITSVFALTRVTCDQTFDMSRISVFPPENQTIAGVFQVSYLNDRNLPVYAFNASEARSLCSSLGLVIASKAQVQEALARGLETCRFGWIDEHFAVVPRSKPLFTCGKNQTGLVPWRAAVTQKFDVFCFNESDAEAQLKAAAAATTTTTTDSSRTSSEALNSTQKMRPTSSSSPLYSSFSSSPTALSAEAEPAQFIGGAQSSSGVKVIIITSTCALLLLAVIIIAYIKMRRGRSQSSDIKPHEEHVQTEEQTCLKTITQTNTPEDQRIEVDHEASD